jgi:hypothetical protein
MRTIFWISRKGARQSTSLIPTASIRRGRVVVFTGDTGPSDGLIELAKGADVGPWSVGQAVPFCLEPLGRVSSLNR